MNADEIQDIARATTMAETLSFPCELLHHAATGRTTKDAEAALNLPASAILKSLILISPSNESVGAIILGSDRLDIKALEAVIDVKKLRFASADEVLRVSTFKVGGVPPIALTQCNFKVADAKVLHAPFVVGAGGTPFCGMRFAPSELLRLSFRICDITKT